MKIVVLDGKIENPGDLSWEPLCALGETEIYDSTSFTESGLIAERLKGADVAVTNKTPISAATIDACEDLKLIAVLATGYNVVDYAYAASKGIPVVNVPGYGTKMVAQYAVGMLLSICGGYAHHNDTVKAGRWSSGGDWCYWDSPVIELAGKTAGIIGLGSIGMATAKILNAMDMRVIAASRTKREEGKKLAEYVDLDTLYRESDVIFLHCPATAENTGMINQESIAKMKDGVILINNARGQLVVDKDLAEALKSGKVYFAGLDVAEKEPIAADDPLLEVENCLITPHISWASKAARQRILDATVNNIRAFAEGKPTCVVNAPVKEK